MISITNRLHHGLMVTPDFLKVIITAREDVQPDRLIGFPIRFQNTGDKWILKPAVNEQMHGAMFFMGYLNGSSTYFFPGTRNDVLQFLLVFLREFLHGFIPVCCLNMIS